MGGSKGGAPPPPDYSGVAAASEKAAELNYKLGSEQLAWAKEKYASDSQITSRVVDSFLESQDLNTRSAVKDRARYEQVYQPLEDTLARDAGEYASDSRRDLEMGRAQAGVAQQFNSARVAAQQQLESFGINPGATRYAALDIGARTQQAAAEAGAGNQASQMVDATGRALRSEAINVGRGYPGQIAGTYGTALQAGSGAVNSTLAQTASGANTMGTAPQYFGLQNQSLGTWGNTLNMSYNNQLSQWKANQSQSSGFGSALGLIGGILPAFFADGGQVPEEASPSGGAIVDDVPAQTPGSALPIQVSAGEFIIPKDVVQTMGTAQLHKLILKARQDEQKLPQQSGAIPSVGRAPAQRAIPMSA